MILGFCLTLELIVDLGSLTHDDPWHVTLLFELMFNMWLVNPHDISCEIKFDETLTNLVGFVGLQLYREGKLYSSS
jgi:hypothetical protein